MDASIIHGPIWYDFLKNGISPKNPSSKCKNTCTRLVTLGKDNMVSEEKAIKIKNKCQTILWHPYQKLETRPGPFNTISGDIKATNEDIFNK